jgi:hypothetical protein
MDDDELVCGLELARGEAPGVDLTEGRPRSLGDQVLDALLRGMVSAHSRLQDPEGRPWAPLAPATVRRKHHRIIGLDTGRSRLLAPSTWARLPRAVQERECWVEFPRSDRRWGMVHGWQNGVSHNDMPPRRLMGWTPEALDAVEALIREATFAAGE